MKQSGANTSATLIVVDDNDDDLFLVERQMSVAAPNWAVTSECRPDRLFTLLDKLVEQGKDLFEIVLLVDVNMPRQGGFETVSLLREHQLYKHLQVLMTSGSDSDADKARADSLGCAGFLAKPFEATALLDAISTRPELQTARMAQ